MKNLRIAKHNAAQIEARLAEVNGRAETPPFTSYSEIEACALSMETRLANMGIAKSYRKGAAASITSGGAVASAYKWMRKATFVHLKRSAGGWTLFSVWPEEIYSSGEKDELEITAEQWERVLRGIKQGNNLKIKKPLDKE